MEITVNGEVREVESVRSIAELLQQFGIHERMVVVEHNGEIVPRAQFAEAGLAHGDNIEIVQMMAGG